MCIVGTAVNQVGSGAGPWESASMKAAGSNLGRQSTDAFAAAVAKMEAEMPPIWKRGMALRAMSSGVSPRDSATAVPLAHRAPLSRGTTCEGKERHRWVVGWAVQWIGSAAGTDLEGQAASGSIESGTRWGPQPWLDQESSKGHLFIEEGNSLALQHGVQNASRAPARPA
jgi:hypothetical protein